MKKVNITLTAVAALLVGAVVGGGIASAVAPSATTGPPQACLDALDDADALMGVSSDFTDAVAVHMDADARLFDQMSRLDFEIDWYIADQQTLADEILGFANRVRSSDYSINSNACRASR